MSNHLSVLVIGAGTIASEYVKVLLAQGHRPIVVGRGEGNIAKVKDAYPEAEAFSGGLENWLQHHDAPIHAIVATPIEQLSSATQALLNNGVLHILAEKPLTYSLKEARELTTKASSNNATIALAFNRRSYVSVQEAKKLIDADGGVSSFHFDFTEATFRIDPNNYGKETNRFWGIANSSHVIDTAFYLGGSPVNMESKQYGEAVSWHPEGSIFTGMGETDQGAPFTYNANWGCPGKWNIEIVTKERKLLFSPMERLHQQLRGSFKVEQVELDYSLDIDYKPGFYNQVSNWVNNPKSKGLITVSEYQHLLDHYNQIFNY